VFLVGVGEKKIKIKGDKSPRHVYCTREGRRLRFESGKWNAAFTVDALVVHCLGTSKRKIAVRDKAKERGTSKVLRWARRGSGTGYRLLVFERKLSKQIAEG